MPGRSRALVSAALFVALGLVGAFVVSIVADRAAGPAVERTADRVADPAADPAATKPGEAGLQARDAGVADRAGVRVEILNGAGTADLARDATRRLRDHGFDVVYFGNASRFDHARSVVLDRRGHPGRARAVAAALAIDSVSTAIDSSLMLEVTVVLGDDWPPAPVPERAWHDRLLDLIRRDSGADPALAPGPSG